MLPLNLHSSHYTTALDEYGVLLAFAVGVTALGALLLAASYVLADQKPDAEKFSSYECGFEPFDDARVTFDIQFYLVGILFVLFDLEIVFLLPWAITPVTAVSFYGLVRFVVLLALGFVYELSRKALD